ncbi:MAG: peptidylprolyl isomerase [Ginsengibacter sp.]
MKNLLYLILIIAGVSCTASKKILVKASQPIKVNLATDSGTIILMLYDKTPLHRNNFVKLVNEKFYDSLLFHRVVNDFMIQGGDPESKNAQPEVLLGEGSLKYTLAAEFDTSLFHKRGALAAAREGDESNPKKESSSTQFYIVDGQKFTDSQLDRIEVKNKVIIPLNHRMFYKTIGGDPFLDMSYTVFGEVISGMDIVEKIANTPKDENNRPLNDIHMKMTIVE